MARSLGINMMFFAVVLFSSCVNSLHPYVYKFGDNHGDVVQTSSGTIMPFVYETNLHVQIPFGMDVTYIEVKVMSLSSPKVDYDNDTRTVTIRFSLTQLTISHYSLLVKAESNA